MYQRRLLEVIAPYEERQNALENNIQEIFEQKFMSEKSSEENKEKNLILKGARFGQFCFFNRFFYVIILLLMVLCYLIKYDVSKN